MYHWREASRLNANIRYLIKRAVLLQIRDTANLSGLLHGKLERLDPLLNFAQLLIDDGKASPWFCQLMQQRILPVVGVAKKSTEFFKWSLKYDFSETKEMKHRDSFLFLIQHTSDSSCSIFNTVCKNNVHTTSGQRDEIWRQLAWPLSPDRLCCSGTALPGRLSESANRKHTSILFDVLFLWRQSTCTHLLKIWFGCYVMDVFQLGQISSGRCQRVVQRLLHISCLNNNMTTHFFHKFLKSYRCTYFSYREIQNCTHINVLFSRIPLHTLTTHIYSLLQNVCFTL